MGIEVLGNLPFQNQLEMGGVRCGCLRQPGMQNLGGGWAEATQETRDDGGGTGKGMVKRAVKGRVWGERNRIRVPVF